MKRTTLIIWFAPLVLAGCTTLIDERGAEAQDAERERLASERVKASIEMLQERVQGMEARQEEVEKNIASLQAAVDKSNRETKETLAAAQQVLKDNDASMTKFKQDIVENAAKNVSEAIRLQPAPVSRTGGQTGREHVVQQGETLSAIAIAYKVKPASIIEANDLKNVNSIRVGQKLFIPEEKPATPRN